MGVWRSCGCPGRVLKVENQLPPVPKGHRVSVGGCLCSLFHWKSARQESEVICVKAVKESLPLGCAFLHER